MSRDSRVATSEREGGGEREGGERDGVREGVGDME